MKRNKLTLLPVLLMAVMMFLAAQCNMVEAASWRSNSNVSSNNINRNSVQKPANNSSMWRKNDAENPAYALNVGLANGITTAAIGMNCEYRIIDMASGVVLQKLNGNTLSVIKPAGNALSINGKPISSKDIVLRPVANFSSNVVIFNGKKYRGALEVKRNNAGSLLVLNNILIDDYLLGTVPSEMLPTWPKAALEAQAVAARTYALYSKGTHSSDGYDLCATTHCQVYEGVANESSTTTAAVNATKGYVITHQGKPICSVFHSSSGGRTDDAENVWGGYVPYLRSVADDDKQSPFNSWTVTFTGAEVQKKLAGAGKNIGNLKSVQQINAGNNGNERQVTVRFVGTAGSVDLSGVKLRSIFGLKSGMVTVRANGGASEVVFSGHGFGHGLGMSQYGAKAMAEKGKSWQEIINHYYTNVDINKRY